MSSKRALETNAQLAEGDAILLPDLAAIERRGYSE